MFESSKETYYETSDIGLATFLLTSGIELLELNRSDAFRVGFRFAKPDIDLLSSWTMGTAMTNAKSFYTNYQLLKRKIFQ